ncbi:hypothetical protein HDU76_002789 [Blyttiomyces sp. JEL0837]|nr:hypothetical protein HDU76_002789 [Blyttiomyces sp. JEL0837]
MSTPPSSSPLSSSVPQIALDYITLKGRSSSPGFNYYKGIPYAAPPVGDDRWKPPKPPINVSGTIYDATDFKNSCWQSEPSIGHTQSEDCLFLNIWTPSTATPSSNYSVMVWIHGGAFQFGSASEDWYDGTNIVKASKEKGNVIYVNLNYRLGLFGFLSNKLLLEEGHGCNFGLMDQEAALLWVKKYISAFGGNPNDITVFGESAGATQSGGPPSLMDMLPPSLQKSQTDRLANLMSCNSNSQDLMSCLRSHHAAMFMTKEYKSFRWVPVVDGVTLTDIPYRLIQSGKFARDVPVLFGTTTDEGTIFTQGVKNESDAVKFVNDFYGYYYKWNQDLFNEMMELYQSRDFKSEMLRVSEIYADTRFACTAEGFIDEFAKAGGIVYNYRFDHGSPPFYSHHTAEIPPIFNTSKSDNNELAEKMSSWWISFAKTGNPNALAAPGSPDWPVFRHDEGLRLVINITKMEVESQSLLHRQRCEFLKKLEVDGWSGEDFGVDVVVSVNETVERVFSGDKGGNAAYQMGQSEETNDDDFDFGDMTVPIFMFMVPFLLLIGMVFWWFVRRSRKYSRRGSRRGSFIKVRSDES